MVTQIKASNLQRVHPVKWSFYMPHILDVKMNYVHQSSALVNLSAQLLGKTCEMIYHKLSSVIHLLLLHYSQYCFPVLALEWVAT